MEETQIVDVLDVPFVEIQTQLESLRQKMEGIQRLGLRFGKGRDPLCPRRLMGSGEKSTYTMNNDSLGG
jgi:hypothetical protein